MCKQMFHSVTFYLLLLPFNHAWFIYKEQDGRKRQKEVADRILKITKLTKFLI